MRRWQFGFAFGPPSALPQDEKNTFFTREKIPFGNTGTSVPSFPFGSIWIHLGHGHQSHQSILIHFHIHNPADGNGTTEVESSATH